MTQRRDVDRLLTTWSEDAYSPPAPAYLTKVLDRTRHTRQRRAWASLERWLPMALTTDRPAAPRALRLAFILLIVVALVVAAAGIAVVGARLLKPSPALPLGGAAVIAFASDVGGQAMGDIYTVRADGTELRRLTNASDAVGADQAPVFSPDGTRIVFRRHQGDSDSIEVIDAGGGNPITLWKSDAGRDVGCSEQDDFAWSPDGQTVAFAAHEACPGQPDLFVAPADGSVQAVKLLPAGTNGAFPTFSPNGRQIALLGSEGGGATGLYVADVGSAGAAAGGLQICRIGPDVEGNTHEQWFPPQWSPDSTELAVAVGPFGNGDIVVVKADGSGQRVLTTDQAANPTWSPDGRRIAFHRIVDVSERWQDRPCTMRVWVINADGTGERRLDPLVDGCVLAPVWSPDGTRLLSLLIVDDYFHVGVLAADGDDPPVVFDQSYGASWQPLAVPLPPAPSFEADAPAP